MLSTLYEMMPEAGDLEKPKMVFFFDEAHLLFTDAPKALLQKIEQVARLIRSKGIGIYFITQSPSDIPDNVLSQLGNKVQHALRAYTPKDQKAVKAAAASFRPNPEFDSETALGELSTGEALISMLDDNGAPSIVERAFMLPPRSFLGVAEQEQIDRLTQNCPLYAKYHDCVDRESAFEKLQHEGEEEQRKQEQEAAELERQKAREAQAKEMEKQQKQQRQYQQQSRGGSRGRSGSTGAGLMNSVLKGALGQVGREVSKDLVRGIFGNLKR